MTEIGMTFGGAMVRSLAAGRKTATRRIVNSGRPIRKTLVPGTRIWVREDWRAPAEFDAMNGGQIVDACYRAGYPAPWCPIEWPADGARTNWEDFASAPGRVRRARYMPRPFARFILTVTEVRVEHVQSMSQADAIAEGIEPSAYGNGPQWRDYGTDGPGFGWLSAVNSFETLWTSIHGATGPKSWAANPLVMAIMFRVDQASAERLAA